MIRWRSGVCLALLQGGLLVSVGLGFWTVSYTHLTLPTNREV